MYISPIQEEILVAGILGDGNFKKNGSNYCYRENHSARELGYLTWKFNMLNGLTANAGIVHEKPKGFSKDGVYSFSTKTNVSFNKYALMGVDEAIENLTPFGLLLFLLDDGWVSYGAYERNWHFLISGGMLSLNQLQRLCDKMNDFGITDAKIIGNVRNDITIPKHNNDLFCDLVVENNMQNLDVVQKKFQYSSIIMG